MALQLAENLYRHLLDILVADYAALPGVDRHAFVVRLDQVFGTPHSDTKEKSGQGLIWPSEDKTIGNPVLLVIAVAILILIALFGHIFVALLPRAQRNAFCRRDVHLHPDRSPVAINR